MQKESKNEANSSNATKTQSRLVHLLGTNFTLTCVAKVVAKMTPLVFEVENELGKLTPKLLNGALSFMKFSESMGSLLDEKFKYIKQLMLLEKENYKFTTLNEDYEVFKVYCHDL